MKPPSEHLPPIAASGTLSGMSQAPSQDRAFPLVEAGTCHVFFAFDVGRSIDLDRAELLITDATERVNIRHKHRAPRYFEYHPAPLRVAQEGESIAVDGFTTTSLLEVLLFDFGAVSVHYRIELVGDLKRLVSLAEDLYENQKLLTDARRRVELLLSAVGGAVEDPRTGAFVEGYSIFEIRRSAPPLHPENLCASHADSLARILRAEAGPLSVQEVADATAARISFGPRDLTLIDWDVALVFDEDAEDVLSVLEFANLELLEMRHLDHELDESLDRAYRALSAGATWWRFFLPGQFNADLRRVGRSQVDSAVLFEEVNNALKLLGDPYLARVYRLAAARFHLSEWDASILRKLETLESIYEKMSSFAATMRMEVLEWIIILLIALSIVLPTH